MKTFIIGFCRQQVLLLFFIAVNFYPAIAQVPADAPSTHTGHRKLIHDFFEKQAQVRYIYSTQISPDGKKLSWNQDGAAGMEIYQASLSNPGKVIRVTAFTGDASGNESEPQYSPSGKEIAFLSEAGSPGQLQVFIADAATGTLKSATALTTVMATSNSISIILE